ncbi:MAG: hypothetical protein QME64_01055 [bacterium]|nr:hypothetical protein [bacterium]
MPIFFVLLFIGIAQGYAVDIQDLSNQFQYQSANTRNSLQNYQRCYDISRKWWGLHEPELALDFLYESAREAGLILPAKLSAMKLLELAELATREYRDRYTAEEMLQKSRDRMKLIFDYYEWREPYHQANRIEKEAEQLGYLPRGKYIPRPVTLPTPGSAGLLPPDYFINDKPEKTELLVHEIARNERQEVVASIDNKPDFSKPRPPLPEKKKPTDLPPKLDKPKPPLPPKLPEKPPLPPEKPPKPPQPPGDKPPRPLIPPEADTTKPPRG